MLVLATALAAARAAGAAARAAAGSGAAGGGGSLPSPRYSILLARSAIASLCHGAPFPSDRSGAWPAAADAWPPAAAGAAHRGLCSSAAPRRSSAAAPTERIRDFAIIAHVDHGKTTLMDRLLSQCGAALTEDRAMDSNALEKERGITILSKVTSFAYGGHTVNAVDTPGHADFGGEVERVLGMVDGAVLLVDASEGPLSQTKFVLGKALARGLTPIVVLNKADRPSATAQRCGEVHSQLFDLFASLGASDEQLDFPVLYASAKHGWAARELPPGGEAPEGASMRPLLDTILSHVPPPTADAAAPFALCVAMIERDPYIGRIATGARARGSGRAGAVRVRAAGGRRRVSAPAAQAAGAAALLLRSRRSDQGLSTSASPLPPTTYPAGRIASGTVAVGDRVRVLGRGGGVSEAAITRILKRRGMERVVIERAVAGDIVSIAGAAAAGIADTIASPLVEAPLDPGHVDPPTLSMVFGPNDSPLAGRSGKAVTGRVISERLQAEAETSVSLEVRPVPGGGEKVEVQARGELQLGILIENMRREGMEISVSPPQACGAGH
jgi:GTP-binding protein